MKMKSKKVLVTGAGGFIGSHLCERLVREGARVRAFLRYNSRADSGLLKHIDPKIREEIDIFWGDLKDPEASRKSVKGNQYIFHLGALIAIPYSYVNPMDFVQTNIAGTANILNACLEYGVKKVIHTSTSEAYGTAIYAPIDEDHPLQAQSPYSASKISADKLAESYYKSFGLPVAVIRPFNTYGPRQSARAVIPTIIIQALTKDHIRLGSLHPMRDMNFVSDTVEGFIKVAEIDKSVGQVINIGSGRERSIGDIAKKIIALADSHARIVTDPKRIRPANSEVERLIADRKKAKKLLDWSPKVSLDEGLKITIGWVRENIQRGYYKKENYQI